MAEIIVEQSNGYDIGFKRNADKEFELVSDLEFWQQKVPVDAYMERLAQRYATNKVLSLAEEKGMTVTEEVNERGTIRIKLSATAGALATL